MPSEGAAVDRAGSRAGAGALRDVGASGAPQQSTVLDNIQTILALEEEHNRAHSLLDRAASVVGRFAGTVTFVMLHLVWLAVWVPANLGWLPFVPVFDAPPFSLLSTIFCVEAVLLSAFVLIKQNQMSKRGDHRDHLELQINLLTEKEVTKVIQMLHAMSVHMGVPDVADEQTRELGQDTPVDELAKELRRSIPEKS